MKNRKELLPVAGVMLALVALKWVFRILSGHTGDAETLSKVFEEISLILMLVQCAISIWAALYSVWMMYKANTARKEGRVDDCIDCMAKIRYTMPLALPLAFIGFRLWLIVLAIVVVYAIYKWGLKLYPWQNVKRVLLHEDGTAWESTILLWINLLFFVGACVVPLVCLVIMIALLYLLGKSGFVESVFRDVNRPCYTCGSCIHYNGGRCLKHNRNVSSSDNACDSFSS